MSDQLVRLLDQGRRRVESGLRAVQEMRETLAIAEKQGMKALSVSARSRLARLEASLKAAQAEVGDLEKLTGALPLAGGGKR